MPFQVILSPTAENDFDGIVAYIAVESPRKHPIARLEAFGPVAEGTATPASDVDLIVTFDP
jgi:predicted nucleotidyltransferase